MSELITLDEYSPMDQFNILVESFKTKLTKKETERYYIEGIFIQAEVKNNNGRIYPHSIIAREVQKYNSVYIKENRALGEADHPENLDTALLRSAILIEKLEMKGNDALGRARILPTPSGKIIMILLDEDVKLGVSTRGAGSVNEHTKRVNEDFSLHSVDVVHNPSAPNAFIDLVKSNRERIAEGVESVDAAITRMVETVDHSATKDNKSRAIRELLTDIARQSVKVLK